MPAIVFFPDDTCQAPGKDVRSWCSGRDSDSPKTRRRGARPDGRDLRAEFKSSEALVACFFAVNLAVSACPRETIRARANVGPGNVFLKYQRVRVWIPRNHMVAWIRRHAHAHAVNCAVLDFLRHAIDAVTNVQFARRRSQRPGTAAVLACRCVARVTGGLASLGRGQRSISGHRPVRGVERAR